MLYKKYHRSYIRQFKVGAKVTYKYSLLFDAVETIIREPFTVDNKVVCIDCSRNRHRLVSPDGKLEQYITNVIQKVS